MNLQVRPDFAHLGQLAACRLCGAGLKHSFVDLGMSPLCESFLKADELDAMEPYFPLHALICDRCFLVQLKQVVNPQHIFQDYAYFSSYSTSWVAHAKSYCEMIAKRLGLGTASLVVELASNDGYLLQHFLPLGVPVLGIEPAMNVAQIAIEKGIATITEFFGVALAKRLAADGKRADLIAGNNVLAQVPDLNDFVAGMVILLKPEGVITLEFPHLEKLIAEIQFDTIYHEHFSYFSFITIEAMAERHRLKLIDVEELTTHGGSLRLFVCQQNSHHVELASVKTLRDEERQAGLHVIAGYAGFEAKCQGVRQAFLAFLNQAKAQGKTVAAYGAAAKGNTFLNYCGVTARDIVCVADLSAAKQGKLLPGSGVPVVAPAELMSRKPDYVVVLPWNLVDEISGQLTGIRAWGGQFVTAIPALKVF